MAHTSELHSHLVGFGLPAGFDVASYDAVNGYVAAIANPNDASAPWKRNAWYGYAAAWNGLAYRLRAAAEYDKTFEALIARSTAPPPEDRYEQERALFGCVASALSAVECLYMATYCMGNALSAAHFPIVTAAHLNKTPRHVASSYLAWLPSEPLSQALSTVAKSVELSQLADLRNSLAHRGILPRQHFLSSVRDIPSALPVNPKAIAADFSYGATLSAATTATHVQWIISTCSRLTGQFLDLAKRNVS